jgi:hypothetical protein
MGRDILEDTKGDVIVLGGRVGVLCGCELSTLLDASVVGSISADRGVDRRIDLRAVLPQFDLIAFMIPFRM